MLNLITTLTMLFSNFINRLLYELLLSPTVAIYFSFSLYKSNLCDNDVESCAMNSETELPVVVGDTGYEISVHGNTTPTTSTSNRQLVNFNGNCV